MMVLDAGATLEWMLGTDPGQTIDALVQGSQPLLNAPELLDVEVASGLRRLCRQRLLPVVEAERVLEDLRTLPVVRHEHGPYLLRAWELRESVSMYDAMYVALAEALDAPLVTCDRRLARSHGHRARIQLVAGRA